MKPYNHRIDRNIIEILYEKGKMSAGELNRAVAKRMRLKRPEIDKMTFNSRLKQMTEEESPVIPYLGHSRYVICPVLERDSSLGIGKKFYYSLSQNARIRRRLELSILWEDKDNEAMYQLLLLVMLLHDAPVEKIKLPMFKTEEELNKFLASINISKNELKSITTRYNNAYGISITTLYVQSDIKIFRVETMGDLEEGYYTYQLSGTSLNDILNHTTLYSGIPFSHIQFAQEEIEKYFELLKQVGLVRQIMSPSLVYLGEIRYEITNSTLENFLHQCWSIYDYSIWRMRSTWSHNRGPKDEEEIWYKIFFGSKMAKNHFEKFRSDRNKLKPQRPRHKVRLRPEIDDIYGYDDKIKSKFKILLKDHSETIKKYSFFSNMIMEWVYPTFLRELQLKLKI